MDKLKKVWRCSNLCCRKRDNVKPIWKYCPSCGARLTYDAKLRAERGEKED